MITVHDTFVCKPGMASKLAKKLKEGTAGFPEFVQILTDATGQFNRVVMICEYENLAAYEKSLERYKVQSDEIQKMLEAMVGYQDMYMTGTRDIFQIW